MGVIKVESFNVNVANGTTHTLTNNVGNLTNAFIRRPGPSDKASGGPTGSTANSNPDDVHCGVELTNTNTITFRAGSSVTRKIMGEVWRYTGSPGGADEFICRSHVAVPVTGATTTTTISGIVDRNKCIPFITGLSTTAGSVNDYDISTFAAHINTNGDLVVSNNNSGASGTVYVDVVEFTGTNWKIGHGISSNHDTADEIITLNTDSTGSGGAIFSVEPTNAILEINMEGDAGGETGLSDVLATAIFTSNTQVQFRQEGDGDGNAANDGDAYIHVFSNESIQVYRDNIVSISETNGGTEATIGFPSAAPTDRAIDELSLEWFPDTTGVGTAHARGRLNARITSATGTIQHWVHRSGNDVDVRYGVIDLTGVTGVANLTVTDVDGDNLVTNTQTNVIVSGIPFESVQGIGKVELVEFLNYTGTIVQQTIINWSNTSITINISAGALADTNCYLAVTTSSGARGLIPITVGIPPLTYSEVVLNLSPDHFWEFNGDLLDTAGVDTKNGSNNIGSPGFSTNPLTRGRTQSFTISAQGQRIEIPDSNYMNLQTETTRTMGGWIRINQVQDSFVCFYEEGGGVNNLAFFMGIGGILIAQLADTSDDNVHAFSDFKLQPNRNYHIIFRFDYLGTRRFELLVDGVLQSSTFGNPLTSAGNHLDSHSGDIGFGDAEGTLEVFGTDITFPAAVTSYYQDWATWTTFLPDSTIRTQLFELGVRGDYTITTDTEIIMQNSLNAYSNTVQPNSDCTFKINESVDGDFRLNVDNITFDEGTTLQFQYLGQDTLTLTRVNGSNLDPNKMSTPNGGTIIITESVPIQITILDIDTLLPLENATVLLSTDLGGDLASGIELIKGTTDVNGIISTNLDYTNNQPVIGRARRASESPFYQESIISGTVTNNGLVLNTFLIKDI